VALACILGVAVPLVVTSSRSTRQQVIVTRPSAPSALPPAAADELLTVTATQVTEVSAVTGAVLRTFPLKSPLVQAPFGPVAVSALARTAYVGVSLSVACNANVIESIDLDTGSVVQVATGATWPAVSPNGSQLAYITFSGANCQPSAVVVQDLTTGTRRTWTMPTSSLVESIHWELDGRHLLLGDTSGSGISILDTAKQAGPLNPLPFDTAARVGGFAVHYQSPVMNTQGPIIAFAPPCWGLTSCPAGFTQGTPIVALDTATGAVTSTIVDRSTDQNLQLYEILTDGTGRIVGVTGGTGNPEHLFKIVGGRLVPFLSQVSAVGWLPTLTGQPHKPATT
jgi:hypothetical protein